jgi:hypothetical protein
MRPEVDQLLWHVAGNVELLSATRALAQRLPRILRVRQRVNDVAWISFGKTTGSMFSRRVALSEEAENAFDG